MCYRNCNDNTNLPSTVHATSTCSGNNTCLNSHQWQRLRYNPQQQQEQFAKPISAPTVSNDHRSIRHSSNNLLPPCNLSGDKRSVAAVAEVRSMSNSMCKMTKRQKMYLMAAAEESSDRNSNASSLAIRSASILAIKYLSPKFEVSKIFRELLQVLTVIFGNASLSIVSEGV